MKRSRNEVSFIIVIYFDDGESPPILDPSCSSPKETRLHKQRESIAISSIKPSRLARFFPVKRFEGN